ncbi:catalase [Chryseobacterium gossypii]|uniref:catalase n=1 Tax=Chryseobacterium gossypii TaxID=3231602 RepID=UPI0035234EC9
MPNPLKYNKKFDKLTEKEKELLEINKRSIADFVEQSPAISDVNYATRNAHAKTYAIAKGQFIIARDIPEDLQQFFDRESYDLIIRFSNAHLKIKNTVKDIPAYGFAVKIKDESGDTLANYPLVNFPLFPINSVSTFLKLFTSINRSFLKKWSLFSVMAQMLKAVPYLFTISFLKNITKLTAKRKDFILSFDYHSVGAYRLGENMIKIRLVPKIFDKNFGRNVSVKEAIESYFKTNDFVADVLIQICYNLKDQPINKLNVEWRRSPFIKIGELKIAKGSLLEPHGCDNEQLSFNPFESRPFFQPVGKIQKLRDEAYKVSLQTRLKINTLWKYK